MDAHNCRNATVDSSDALEPGSRICTRTDRRVAKIQNRTSHWLL